LDAPLQAAEKVASGQEPRPQRLKPHSKQCSYRSAEALRHPKIASKIEFFRNLFRRWGDAELRFVSMPMQTHLHQRLKALFLCRRVSVIAKAMT
jgi:hypothetical protein